MKVFMIGGTGLLGCEAARIFIERGHEVKSVALPPLPEGAPIPKEMEIEFCNIYEKTDDEIREMIKGYDCFVFAAGVDERVEFPAPVYDAYYNITLPPSRGSCLFVRKPASRRLLSSAPTSHISQRPAPI